MDTSETVRRETFEGPAPREAPRSSAAEGLQELLERRAHQAQMLKETDEQIDQVRSILSEWVERPRDYA